ncbi:MAG TPA: DUF6600 domain-containing protein [Terriglobales bacterium]|nr:DUF6600 domain-containing protein [Terriglobales bacterium]
MSPRRVMLALPVVLVVLLALYLTPAAAWADSHARIVRLSYVEGDVQIDRADGQGFQRAFLNLPITQGSRLQTHDDGRAEIEFEDGSTLRLVPDTNLNFDQLGLRDSGAKFTFVTLEQGTAYFDLREKGKDEFTITAGSGQRLELPRSSRFRVNVNPTGIKLAVFDGEVEFQGPDKPVAVKKNETLDTDRTDRFYTSKNVIPEPYDSWMQERDQYRKQYSSNSAYNLSSPYLYGRADLNYYGNYFDSPYGYLWRPWSAGSTWDPFLDGAWVFYPGSGYTWVSAHPWGWLPYHYGSWIYFEPYGWCWQPSRVWNNWLPVAIIRNPRPGFIPPRPPTNGHSVVIIGRGPNRGIIHNSRLEDRSLPGLQTQMPRSSSLLKWPGPTIRLPQGAEGREQELDRRGFSNLFPRNPKASSIRPVAPLVPSTLAPLRPTGPSAPIVPHWPAPVMTQPRIPSAPHMSSPQMSSPPHMMTAPSIHMSVPHPSRR